jgi:hypothetical protein
MYIYICQQYKQIWARAGLDAMTIFLKVQHANLWTKFTLKL